jgi:hypothetical protein
VKSSLPPSSSSFRASTELPAACGGEQEGSAGTDTSPPPSSKAAMRAYGPIVPRDTDDTAFTKIIDDLIQRVPGAFAAALVDGLGETVDYSGRGDPFDLKLSAAHLQIILAELQRWRGLGEPRWLVIRGQKKSVAASALPDGYALILLLRPRSAFTISTRALKVCIRALATEAGWDNDDFEKHDGEKQERSWFPMIVDTDKRGRPLTIGASREPSSRRVPVEVLGTVMGLSVRERGFRVRTVDGSELMLVREPRERWYADTPV